MTDPDYRALCAELVNAIDSGISTDRMHLSPVMLRARAALAEPELCNLHREMVAESVARRARAALAQPEPVTPTDEALLASVRHFYGDQAAADMGAEDDLRTARAVLARWGTPANTTREESFNG